VKSLPTLVVVLLGSRSFTIYFASRNTSRSESFCGIREVIAHRIRFSALNLSGEV
jgi:hypothetical protein